MNTYEEKIMENALKPKTVQTDSGKVTQHSIKDQLRALDELKKLRVKGSQMSRFGFYKLVNLG